MRTATERVEVGDNPKQGETGRSGELEVRKQRNLQKMATTVRKGDWEYRNAKNLQNLW